MLLAARKSPMYLRDRLSGFLPAESRDFYDVMPLPSMHTDSRASGAANARPGAAVPRLKVAWFK